ncbi:BRK domain containing protein [Echinococcus multilocularis]|uniref:BRK domain containing protein n=1 Tax=Echinococcus multilocularis TaxID=6211 RepID=A0A087VWW4_ECHMU|nr:BRK domain containing protein [Echinococcus multilocularis]
MMSPLPPDSSTMVTSVPVIAAVNENLIHGAKAPKRGHLEAWLEVHADDTLYCVESEDKAYVDRAVVTHAASSSIQRSVASASSVYVRVLMEHQQEQLFHVVSTLDHYGNPRHSQAAAAPCALFSTQQ